MTALGNVARKIQHFYLRPEISKRTAEAYKDLQTTKRHAAEVRQHVYLPGQQLKDDNNYANIIKTSLQIGHHG